MLELDLANLSEEQKDSAKIFASEKPIYANMLMEKILMKVEVRGGLHSFGSIARLCMELGISKEQMQQYIAESFSDYWDEVESQA